VIIHHIGFSLSVPLNRLILLHTYSIAFLVLVLHLFNAIVTCVLKILIHDLSDFRPTSVTPILSCVVERIEVTAANNPLDIADKFGFQPKGSTTCASRY
jgi:hypothetical protein